MKSIICQSYLSNLLPQQGHLSKKDILQTGVFDKGISDAAITAVAHIKRLLKDDFVNTRDCTQNGNVFWQFTHVFLPLLRP